MKRIVIPILVISFILNVALLMFAFTSSPITAPSLHKGYPYLSKRIFVENQNDVLVNFTKLRLLLKSYFATIPNRTGVYFEYLPSGTSIGINEKEQFIPASLVKVPIVMAVYKKIESGKLKKNDFVALEERFKDKTAGALWEERVGARIAVKDAIDKTLDDSDNTAKNILLSLLTRDEISFVFDSLDIDLESENDESATVTPKNYSSILRSLYLSSYLTQEHSNEMLELMTQSSDDLRLRSGIPDGIPVASKYGISYGARSSESVYSDCGIIYVPKRPFLVCVMIQSNEEEASKIMKNVAEMTYSFVSQSNL